jgi:hypothetical protein
MNATAGEYTYVVRQIPAYGHWYVIYWGGPNEDGEMQLSGAHTTERRARNWAVRNLKHYSETDEEASA